MLGSGATVAYGTTSWSASIISVDSLTVNGEKIETSHLLTSNGSTPAGKTFLPGKVYEITAELTVIAAPGTAIPILQTAETITFTWADASTTSFSGFNTSAAIGGVTNDGQVTTSVSIAGTGDITNFIDHS